MGQKVDLTQIVKDYQGKYLKEDAENDLTIGNALAFSLAMHKVANENYMSKAKRSMLARQIAEMTGEVEFNAKQTAMLLDAVGAWEWPRGGEVDLLLALDPKLKEQLIIG